jgi:hypothetical protein
MPGWRVLRFCRPHLDILTCWWVHAHVCVNLRRNETNDIWPLKAERFFYLYTAVLMYEFTCRVADRRLAVPTTIKSELFLSCCITNFVFLATVMYWCSIFAMFKVNIRWQYVWSDLRVNWMSCEKAKLLHDIPDCRRQLASVKIRIL